jgi:hypothetical protein
VGPSRQSAAIVIRQMQATIPKLSTQESIFFDKVRDGLSLPPSQPANEHAQHYLQRDGVDHGTELISRRRPKDVGRALGHYGCRTATNLLFSWGQFWGSLRRFLSGSRVLSWVDFQGNLQFPKVSKRESTTTPAASTISKCLQNNDLSELLTQDVGT